MEERTVSALPGIPMILVMLILTGVDVWALVSAVAHAQPADLLIPTIAVVVLAVCWRGFFMVQPNNGVVLQLFGRYVGTCRDAGLRWTNPFYAKRPVSLRVRNFESGKLKVNDLEGSPIEIAAVVVWQVQDTAEACFNVDDYENFVHVQSEAALRQLATSYPYDLHDQHHISLRSHSREISTAT